MVESLHTIHRTTAGRDDHAKRVLCPSLTSLSYSQPVTRSSIWRRREMETSKLWFDVGHSTRVVSTSGALWVAASRLAVLNASCPKTLHCQRTNNMYHSQNWPAERNPLFEWKETRHSSIHQRQVVRKPRHPLVVLRRRRRCRSVLTRVIGLLATETSLDIVRSKHCTMI